MLAALTENQRYKLPAWLSSAIWLWTVLTLSADLKVSFFTYVHWLVFAFLGFALLLWAKNLKVSLNLWVALPAVLFVVSIVVVAFFSGQATYDLAQAAKLTVIFLMLMLLLAMPEMARVAFKGFIFSVYLNFTLLLLGHLGISTLASEMALGRWGTVLNFPGSLWKTGIIVLVFAAYHILRRPSVASFSLLICSLAVIYWDGSRTAYILLAIAGVYLGWVLLGEFSVRARFLIVTTFIGLSVSVITILGGLVIQRLQATSDINLEAGRAGGVERIAQFVTSILEGKTEGLVSADPLRSEMLKAVLSGIQEHPLLGTGLETTRADSIIGPMVIHMTYLQVWSDVGILGFLAFVSLVLGWLAFVPRFLKQVRQLGSHTERGVYYNAGFLLIYFAATASFHPLSTEWSEWITFMVPSALFWQMVFLGRRTVAQYG